MDWSDRSVERESSAVIEAEGRSERTAGRKR